MPYETHRSALANEVERQPNHPMSPGRRRVVYDPWVRVIDSDILDRTNGQGASQERPKCELEGLHVVGTGS